MVIKPLRIDQRSLATEAVECRAFMTVKNELVRLRYWLTYHRQLGVQRFFINDNGSTDGTADYVLAQPDCHLFSSPGSFREADQGISWLNLLVEEYGEDHWCLFLDADECFVYPWCEHITLNELCDHLDTIGAQGVYSFLLDMYSMGAIAEAHYQTGQPFLQTCNLFDTNYHIRPMTWRPGGRPFPYREAIGGPRLRVFYPHLVHASSSRLAAAKAARKLRNSAIGRSLKLQRTLIGSVPPLLNKIPLIRGGGGRRWADNHSSTPLKLASLTGVTLHFKYFSDFHARVMASDREYYDSGREYQQYADLLVRQPALSFCYPESHRYRDSQQLLNLGLLYGTPELLRIAQ